MSEEKKQPLRKDPSQDKKNLEKKKSFGADLEDELTPITLGHIFNKIVKTKQKRDESPASELKKELPTAKPVGEEPKIPEKTKAEEKPKSSPSPGDTGTTPEQEMPITPGIPKEEEDSYDPDIDGVFLQLIDEYMPRSEPVEIGDIMEVPVLEVRPDCVLVDIGDKTEGMVDIAEFMSKSGDVAVSSGEVVEVMIEGRDEETDQVILSHKKAIRKSAIEWLRRALEEKTSVRGKVVNVVKGGLIVDVGIPCFMPASQIDTSRVEDLSSWLGREVEAYVLEFNLDRRRAILSRRRLIKEDLEKRRQALLQSLKPGDFSTVRIKSILDFGAFADMGPMDGFIPREEVSYERAAHPSMFLKENQEVKVKVIKVDREAGKIALSRKQARVDPWLRVGDKHSVGSIVIGRVVSITNYGAFVQIEEGLTGMIHASNLSWDKGPKRPEQFMKEGDIVKAVVLNLDKESRKMALGLKQITQDPWIEVEGKYQAGLRVKGTVTTVTDFGAFVKLDENIEGLIHISNMTWDTPPRKPKHYLKSGEEVETVILQTNREGRRISLGLRQLQKSPLERFLDSHRIGEKVEGTVTRLTSFGAFVELEKGVEGLMHVSQIAPERIEHPGNVLKEGDKIQCKITKIGSGGRKISLSRKELIKEEEKKAIKQYLKSDVKGGVNVGELLKNLDLNLK